MEFDIFKKYCPFIDGIFNHIAISKQSAQEAFDIFKSSFNYSFGSIEEDENLISIHSGGWSDNEELISYFKDTIWWKVYWVASTSGGHYYFDTNKHRGEKEWSVNKRTNLI